MYIKIPNYEWTNEKKFFLLINTPQPPSRGDGIRVVLQKPAIEMARYHYWTPTGVTCDYKIP